MADAGGKIRPLLDGIFDSTAVELASCLTVLYSVVRALLACAASAWCSSADRATDEAAVGQTFIGCLIHIVVVDADAGTPQRLHEIGANTLTPFRIPYKPNKASTLSG